MEIVGKKSRFKKKKPNNIPLLGHSMCLLALLALPH
jgi:hypothetical protein